MARCVPFWCILLAAIMIAPLCWAVDQEAGDHTHHPDEVDDLMTLRDRRQTGNDSGCGHVIFERVMDCCDVPMLLSLAAFQNNTSGLIKNDRQVVRILGYKFVLPAGSGKKSGNANPKSSNFRNVTGGRLCVYENVFKSQGLLGSSGNVDMAVVTSKFLAVVSPSWKPVVQAALTNCSAQIPGLNTSVLSTPRSGGKVCNPGAALLMSCVHRYNNLNCPTAVAFTGANCKADLQTLRSCDVFAGLRTTPTA